MVVREVSEFDIFKVGVFFRGGESVVVKVCDDFKDSLDCHEIIEFSHFFVFHVVNDLFADILLFLKLPFDVDFLA